jgi:hypothetical protein
MESDLLLNFPMELTPCSGFDRVAYCRYWEVVELSRKLVLSGLVGLVGRGTIAQSTACTFISFFYCPDRRGQSSALSVFLCKSVLYGGFVWACRALKHQKRRFPARAVAASYRHTPYNSAALNTVKLFSELAAGLGRFVALYYRSSTSYRISSSVCEVTIRPNPRFQVFGILLLCTVLQTVRVDFSTEYFTPEDYGIALIFLCVMIFPITIYLIVTTGWAMKAELSHHHSDNDSKDSKGSRDSDIFDGDGQGFDFANPVAEGARDGDESPTK